MHGQKGSLLDKIKAFFIRRRDAKLKKKLQQQKELEEILKNINEKVESIGTPINVGVKFDKINLNKVKLDNSKIGSKVVSTFKDSVEVDATNSVGIKTIKSTADNFDKNIFVESTKPYGVMEEISKQNTQTIDLDNVIDNKVQFKFEPIKEEVKVDQTIIHDLKKDIVVENKKQIISKKSKVIEPNPIVRENKKVIVVTSKKHVSNIGVVGNNKIKPKPNKKINLKSKKNLKSKEEELSLVLLRMIERNLAEINYFKEEISYLTDMNKQAKTQEEIFEIEQRFLILKERIEKVYQDFLLCRDSNIMNNVDSLDYNEELVELVTKYKLDIYENDNIGQILRNIEQDYKQSLNIIESIVCLEESKEVLGEELYQNKEDITVRNEKLTRTDEVVQKIDYMKQQLDQDLSKNKDIIDNILVKVASIHPEERVQYTYNIVRNMFSSVVNFGFSMALLNPRRGRFSNALGAVSMVNTLRSFGRVFQPDAQVYYISSDNFQDEILQHLNDFSYVNRSIDMSIEEIDKIKEKFNEEFIQYIDELPEFRETYNNINKLQEQLKDIKIEMIQQEMKLENSLSLNNQIVKRIENN